MPTETNPYESPTVQPSSALSSDSVFWGLLATQFLGAFNDNYFKQMVLLKCTEVARSANEDLQPMAMAAFALPFVLLSGLGGFLSDRFSKRTIIVLCKVLEIVVMAAALQVLLMSQLTPTTQLKGLILVLALMGAQSAIFSPSKYGILPELFHGKKLLPVNGAIQMTTFLAIIFGMAGAGIALDRLNNSLWFCSVIAVGIAVMGTAASFLVRSTPIAEPDLQLRVGNLFVPGDIWQLFKKQRGLFSAVMVMTLFWFIGGVAQPAVNNLGEKVLLLNKTRTSLMAASIGVGIAVGCVVAGFVNKDNSDGARWTTRGSWMIFGSLILITTLATGWLGHPQQSSDVLEGLLNCLFHANAIEWALRGGMFLLGLSAGVFVVPIQVYVQESPPAAQKGRLIGAMNLMTWIGILLSAAYLLAFNWASTLMLGNADSHQAQRWIFATLALVILPVALFYRLPTLNRDTDPA